MHTAAYTAGFRLGKSAACLATLLRLQRPAKLKPRKVAAPTIVGYFNVLDRPVQLVRSQDDSETAIDRAGGIDMPVPVEWVLAFGKSVSWQEYVGLVTARRLALKAPKVLVAPDGHEALIVTPKTTCSRRHWGTPKWKTGTHFTAGEIHTLHLVDRADADTILWDSQLPHSRWTLEQFADALGQESIANLNRNIQRELVDADGTPLLTDDDVLEAPLTTALDAAKLARLAIAKAAAK